MGGQWCEQKKGMNLHGALGSGRGASVIIWVRGCSVGVGVREWPLHCIHRPVSSNLQSVPEKRPNSSVGVITLHPIKMQWIKKSMCVILRVYQNTMVFLTSHMNFTCTKFLFLFIYLFKPFHVSHIYSFLFHFGKNIYLHCEDIFIRFT